MKSPGVKIGVYLQRKALEELRDEAARLDRSVSWLLQMAWEVARSRIAKLPAHRPGRKGEG